MYLAVVTALAMTVFGLSYLGGIESTQTLIGLSTISVGSICFIVNKVTT